MAELEKLLCTDSKVESLKKINAIIENGGGGSGHAMFDTVLKDHILTYKESKGLALQGTYVYKEAIAGSRYGYPDFYNKCLEEFNEATNTESVNGVTIKVHSNGHKFYNIADKANIDSFFSTMGSAWFYGIDTENERIFLPRNNWFEQVGGIDEVGDSVEAGLPNITGGVRVGGYKKDAIGGYTKGALSYSGTGGASDDFYGGSGNGFTHVDVALNASSSNPIYGNSDTVQPNAVKKLLYICVGNTESQSTITDVVDVTTTENDTLPLGYSTYQNGTQPSVSWLKSQGQWNDGNVYTTFYNEFVNKLGQAFASGYVKEYTDSYDDYDLVINQDNMTFRLPLLDGSEDLVSDRYDDLTLKASESEYIASANGWVTIKGTSTATNPSIFIKTDSRYISEYSNFNNVAIGATLYVSKGCKFVITYNYITNINFKFTYAQGNGSLYFKVANAVQNLELLNAGEVLEAVNNVIPNNAGLIANYSMPSSKYVDFTVGASGSQYTAPANGWMIGQGTGSYVQIANDTKPALKMTGTAITNVTAPFAYIPCQKGDVISFLYNTGATRLRFFYAEGEV